MTDADDAQIDPNDPLMQLIRFAANPPRIPDLPARFDPEKVELPEYLQWARKEYVFMRVLDDGRVCGIHRLMFHWTIHIDLTPIGYEDRYCYEDLTLAIIALQTWSGEGDPIGWHKHPKSGRTRNLRTGRESFEWEPELPEERDHASR